MRKKWTEEQKTMATKLVGLAIGLFALFTFISIVSYMATWKQDMSVSEGAALQNAGGSLGYRFGQLLVCECFGFGSLAFLLILVALAIRLVGLKWKSSLVGTTFITIGGALIASITLSYIGKLAGAEFAFGGGLGGRCGAIITNFGITQIGTILTGAIIVFLLFLFLIATSKTFYHKVISIGKIEKQMAKDLQAFDQPFFAEAEQAPAQYEPEPEPQPEPKPQAPKQAPQPQPAPSDTPLEIQQGELLESKNADPLKRIDNRLDMPDGLPNFNFPPISLLEDHSQYIHNIQREELERNKTLISNTLENYKINVSKVTAVVGPTVTLYKVTPAPGVKISAIRNLQDDIAMNLKAKGVRVTTLTDSVGIEVANDTPSIVTVKSLFNSDQYRNSKAALPVAIGYAITSQQVKVFDLADAPHLLIAGATQQGKSVGLNVIISSLLYSKHPSELKFVFIDPKMVEFPAYKSLLKHYLAVMPTADGEEEEENNAIVTKAKDAEKILRSLCMEMDERYELMAKAGAVKVSIYNDKYRDRKLNPSNGHKFLPYIVAVVDEYADLTMTVGASPETKAASKSITNSIIRLAQKGRAAGIHIILATQRPSVDVISGIIKTNFPMRIAFRTSARIDSMTIIDAPGAEKLIGRGDMLIAAGCDTERAQCGFISSEEIDKLTQFIGNQTKFGQRYNTPYYLPEAQDASGEGGGVADMSDLDERFEEAAKLVVTTQKASTSYLQTRMAMGFAKAARVMSQLESAGIIGPQDGAKPRQILVQDLDSLDELLSLYR